MLILTAGTLFSVDFGGIIDNTTAFGNNAETPFQQSDKLSLWFNTGTEKNLIFSVMGSYTYSLERPYLFNLDDFQLKGNYFSGKNNTTNITFNLGRFILTDPTKYVLNHRIDGFSVGVGYPKFEVKSAFGFTGLELKPVSEIVLSKTDVNAFSEDLVKLASPRMVGSIVLRLPNLFLRQNLDLSFLFQEDLRPLIQNDSTPATLILIEEGEEKEVAKRGGALDTQYSSLKIGGPVIEGIFYDVFFILGTGRELSFIDSVYSYVPILSYNSGLNLRYYNEDLLYSRINAGFVFSSGDADNSSYYEGSTAGKSTIFLPMTEYPFAALFNPQVGNLGAVSLGYSVKPLSFLPGLLAENFQAELDGILFFRTSEGSISEGVLDLSKSGAYLGTEIDFGLNFRPFSDLGFSSTTAFFFPNESIFADGEGGMQFEEKIEFSLSF